MIGYGPIIPGNVAQSSGGGGGSASLKTVTVNLTAGVNNVVHNLGSEPTSWIIQDATGRTLVYAAEPNGAAPTTTLDVTALKADNNATVTVFAES